MNKSKGNKLTKRKVLLKDMTDGKGYQIASNPGSLFIYSYGRGRQKHIGIYGDPKGLRFLATLLNNIADVDQSRTPDLNCPPSEGVHYHMDVRDGHLHPRSVNLIFGRLDAKGDGSQSWILPESSAS
jgi:hypothetical protein